MRILKILNGNDDGGVFTCETQYISELKKQNVFVYGVIIGEGKSTDYYKEILNGYLELPAFNAKFSGSLINILKGFYRAYNYGKKQSKQVFDQFEGLEFDAIIYRRVTFLFFAGIIGEKMGKPTFWHMPNIVSSKFSYLFYNLFLRLFLIEPVANSKYTQSTIGRICKEVIYPGFDAKRVQGGTMLYREKLRFQENVPVYGIAARINPDKAQDIIVKAFIKSEAANRGGHLLIAGGIDDQEYFDKIEKLAGSYWNRQIHYLGRISDLNNFFASIDVMINGRVNAEPFGISIAESLGAGVPVIAYYLGGPEEMIEHGETGWLVRTATVEAYCECLNESLSMGEQFEAMKYKCRQKSGLFSVESNIKKFIQVISARAHDIQK